MFTLPLRESMQKLTKPRTDHLFPRMNFWTGAATVLSLRGRFYRWHTSETEQQADEKALANDVAVLAADAREIKDMPV